MAGRAVSSVIALATVIWLYVGLADLIPGLHGASAAVRR
jgi:hypothetical protein